MIYHTLGELLNYGWAFEFWMSFWIMDALLNYGWTFELLMKMDSLLCEIGVLTMQYRISSSFTIDCVHCNLDFFICDIELLQIWNCIFSKVKLDFFQCEIWFLPTQNWITSNLKLDFFYCEVGFFLSLIVQYIIGFMVLTWT